MTTVSQTTVAPNGVVSTTQGMVVSPGTAQTVVINAPGNPPLPSVCENYSVKQAWYLGIIQTGIGALCIILQIAAMSIDAHASDSASGIWCGIFFLISGVLGIMTSRTKGRGLIVTCMVMCIISSVMVLPVFISTIVGISHDGDDNYCNRNKGWFEPDEYCEPIEDKDAKIGLNVTLLILSILECVFAIWAAVVCCNAVCCGRGRMGGMVITTQTSGQVQVVGPQTLVMQQPGVVMSQPVVYNQQQPVVFHQQPPAPVHHQQPQYNPQMPPTYSAAAPPPAYSQIQSSAPPSEAGKH